MFVTYSDFDIPPYDIPALKTGDDTTFAHFITREEEKYLREVMGDQLYEAFISGLDELPGVLDLTAPTVISQQYVYGNDVWQALTVTTGVKPTEGTDWTLIEANNRWLLIQNGSTYLYSGKNYRWAGMKGAIMPLVYCHWVEYRVANLTTNGFVIPKMENNINTDAGVDICRAWNDWSRRIGGPCEQKNTLYGYLYNTELSSPGTFDDTFDDTFTGFIDYLNYEFKQQGKRNDFDL